MSEHHQAHPLDGLRADFPAWHVGEHYHAQATGPGCTVYQATCEGICVTAYNIPSLRRFLAEAEAGRAKPQRLRLRVVREGTMGAGSVGADDAESLQLADESDE